MGICDGDELAIRRIEVIQLIVVGKFFVRVSAFGDWYAIYFTGIPLMIIYPFGECISDSRLAFQRKVIYVFPENLSSSINNETSVLFYDVFNLMDGCKNTTIWDIGVWIWSCSQICRLGYIGINKTLAR